MLHKEIAYSVLDLAVVSEGKSFRETFDDSVAIAQLADRSKRIPIAVVGALVWGLFSGLTGIAMGVIVLTVARSGSSLGKAVVDPTHNSLIADYYPIEVRAKVFSFHRSANAVGAFVGPLSAGFLAHYFGWRTPFLIFTIPTVILAVLAIKLREPIRGFWERKAMGVTDEVANTEEEAPSFSESWRTVQKVQSLKRIWYSLPFLATGLIGFGTLASLLYDQEFGLDERARGIAAAIADFKRSCAFPYAVKSPFARADLESASACRASASALAKSFAPVVGFPEPVDSPLPDVPESPANT